ncbi:hypothetical protein [Cedecea sp.]|uniref:hypothetical protein n=1 Tax=Cedecea sp. TaxID=1970739 RepID=UPI002F3F7836
MIDQTITLESFADLLVDEGLTSAFLESILSILAEIKPHAAAVQANTPELVQLAALHSATFLALPAQKQQFCASVLSMPIFFITQPSGEEEANQWMKENWQ